MAREEEFLAAVEAAPDDLVLRNVFADWLDENGRDGGPFLRAECRLVDLPLGTPEWHETFGRCRGAGESLPDEWRMAVERYDEAHWLRMATRSAWIRLDRWLVDGEWQFQTGSGASTKEIDAIERAIGQELPP